MPQSNFSYPQSDPSSVSASGSVLIHSLACSMANRMTRATFFNQLAAGLKKLFHYDRLCINLCDLSSNMISLFTAAEGMGVSSLSQERVAGANTVAGHVIRTRRPIVIMDLARHFPGGYVHPMAEVGIVATMAFPLIINDELLATLHCSFAKEPDDIYNIMELLLEICPVVAGCLALILYSERLENAEIDMQPSPAAPSPATFSCVFASQAMTNLVRKARQIARLNVPVLILGETGTGKSMLAQIIHRESPRADKKLVTVNCPALADSLFESELFGHAKGAFTGAAGKRVGRFELAHRGTLFLDEIGELSPKMQTKLLQVLENQTFERVGESNSITVDVRLISATNLTLDEALGSKRLRTDLFYRISAAVLTIPPLRERPDDILPLVRYFSDKISKRMGLARLALSARGMRALSAYSWPGNVRELRNVVNRLLILQSLNKKLTARDVDEALGGEIPGPLAPPSAPSAPPSNISLKEAERQHILRALQKSRGVVAGPDGAARRLGIPRTTLQHRLKKLGIGRDEWRNFTSETTLLSA